MEIFEVYIGYPVLCSLVAVSLPLILYCGRPVRSVAICPLRVMFYY